jgi:hypothetical protein
MNEYNNLKTGGNDDVRRSENVSDSVTANQQEADSNQEMSYKEADSSHVASIKTRANDYFPTADSLNRGTGRTSQMRVSNPRFKKHDTILEKYANHVIYDKVK